MKRALGIIAGIAVTIGCLWFSMRGTSWAELKAGFTNANYLTLPLMMGLLFAFYWLKAVRWSWLLAPIQSLTPRQLMPPLLIGFAANNILPAHLGEFVRVFVVNRQRKIPATTVLSTVVLERIFDVIAILSLFGIGLAFTENMPDEYRLKALVMAGLFAGVILCVVVYLFWTEWFLKLFEATTSWMLPQSVSEKLVGMLRTGADGLAALNSGRVVALIMVNSLAQWLCNGLMAYIALYSFHIPVTPLTGLIVTGITAMAVTVPSTPGYFGVIQACFVVCMKTQGVKADESLVLASSFYYHLSMYIPVTLLGLYFLNSLGLSVGDLTKAVNHEDEEGADTPLEDDEDGQQPVAVAVVESR